MDIHISKVMQERVDRVRAQRRKANRANRSYRANRDDREWERGCTAVLWFCGIVFAATGLYLYFTL